MIPPSVKKNIRLINALFVIILFLSSSIILPATFATDSSSYTKGYEKGVSWNSVIPIRKATFVNYDDESYLDDYAYLAAIPSSVFNDGKSPSLETLPQRKMRRTYISLHESHRRFNSQFH